MKIFKGVKDVSEMKRSRTIESEIVFEPLTLSLRDNKSPQSDIVMVETSLE